MGGNITNDSEVGSVISPLDHPYYAGCSELPSSTGCSNLLSSADWSSYFYCIVVFYCPSENSSCFSIERRRKEIFRRDHAPMGLYPSNISTLDISESLSKARPHHWTIFRGQLTPTDYCTPNYRGKMCNSLWRGESGCTACRIFWFLD